MKKILITMLLLASTLGAASAQKAPHANHSAVAQTSQPASTKAFEAANEKMHKDMAIQFSGNADVDFVRGMIPHHQGAIDMAKVVLEHGKDPAIRKLAQDVIKAQTEEIAMMNEWLKKNGK